MLKAKTIADHDEMRKREDRRNGMPSKVKTKAAGGGFGVLRFNFQEKTISSKT